MGQSQSRPSRRQQRAEDIRYGVSINKARREQGSLLVFLMKCWFVLATCWAIRDRQGFHEKMTSLCYFFVDRLTINEISEILQICVETCIFLAYRILTSIPEILGGIIRTLILWLICGDQWCHFDPLESMNVTKNF